MRIVKWALQALGCQAVLRRKATLIFIFQASNELRKNQFRQSIAENDGKVKNETLRGDSGMISGLRRDKSIARPATSQHFGQQIVRPVPPPLRVYRLVQGVSDLRQQVHLNDEIGR